MIFLLVYVLGLPVMFWASARFLIWPELAKYQETEWDGMTWFLVLMLTFLWPFTWVVLVFDRIINKANRSNLSRFRFLYRWTAPKRMRKDMP